MIIARVVTDKSVADLESFALHLDMVDWAEFLFFSGDLRRGDAGQREQEKRRENNVSGNSHMPTLDASQRPRVAVSGLLPQRL